MDALQQQLDKAVETGPLDEAQLLGSFWEWAAGACDEPAADGQACDEPASQRTLAHVAAYCGSLEALALLLSRCA